MTDIQVHRDIGPTQTITQRTQHPSGPTAQGTTSTGIRQGKEYGEEVERSVEHGIEKLKKTGERLYDQTYDVCRNWRHYPKLVTVALLLSSFLLGGLTTGLVQNIGRKSITTAHWDRETANAHHLLDVIIDEIRHPHLYESRQSASLVTKAKNTLYNIFGGILPSSIMGGVGGKRSAYGVSGGASGSGMKGQPMFDPRTGRKLGSKMGEMMEDAGDTASDIYNVGMRTAKKAGRKIGDVASDAASSVKGVFSQDANYPVHDESSWSHGGGGWFGGSDWHGDENNEELNEATSQLRNIIRKAERNQ